MTRNYEEEALPMHWTEVERLGKSDTLRDPVRFRRSTIYNPFFNPRAIYTVGPVCFFSLLEYPHRLL